MSRSVVAVMLLVLCADAAAQSGGAQAEALFRQGRDLMAANKYQEACAAFAESQRLDPAITTLVNLAGCREKAAQYATAWGLFLEAERQTRAAADANTKKIHDVAADRAKKLEARVSKLTINVAHSVAGLEIMRGNEPVTSAMWNHVLPIDGGTYTISARAPGKAAWSTQITVAPERDTKTVDVPELASAPGGAVTTSPVATATTPEPHEIDEPEQPAPTKSRVVPFVVGGIGLGLVGGAIGLELSARSTYDDAKAEMTSQTRRDDLYNSANTKRHVAQGMAVAGAAGIGIAVWLLLRSGESDTSTATAVRVVPTSSGISIMGSY
jgi:hypothetical protein